MTCSKCKNVALKNIEYAGKKYCEKHFLELMNKRVRKNLRTRKLIDVKSEYFLLDDDSSEVKLTQYFLDEIFKGHLKFRVGKKNSSNLKLIVPTNLDEQANIFLGSFLKNKKDVLNDDVAQIMPLEALLQKEVELLCSILKIKFKPRVKKDILIELENKHPGTKFSVFQSKMNVEQKFKQ
jgi:hypothetical protein